jgi:hypothetical protein
MRQGLRCLGVKQQGVEVGGESGEKSAAKCQPKAGRAEQGTIAQDSQRSRTIMSGHSFFVLLCRPLLVSGLELLDC